MSRFRTLQWLCSQRGCLKERAARGGIWLVLGDAVSRSFGLLKYVIVGRFLSPADFGLAGIATLMTAWIAYFTQTGLDAALIQKQGEIRSYLDTVWTVQVLRSVAVATIIFAAAPLGAGFFGAPAAVPVIRAVALEGILWALRNPAVLCFRKDLDFRKEVLLRATGTLAGFAIAVGLGAALQNVWVLVFSVLGGRAVEVIASYRIDRYRPRPRLDWRRLRELTKFGKWVFGCNVLAFFDLYMDSTMVGRLLAPYSLGVYRMAGQFAHAPAAQAGSVIHGVMFSAFSRIGDIALLRRAFLSTFTIVVAAVLPFSMFLTVFADPVVELVLGRQWAAASAVTPALAWAGFAKAAMGATNPVLLSAGEPRLSLRTTTVNVGTAALLLYPLITHFGLPGAGIAIAFSSLLALGCQLAAVRRLTGATAWEILSALKIAGLAACPILLARVALPSAAGGYPYLAAGTLIAAYGGVLVWLLRTQLRFGAGKVAVAAPAGGRSVA